MGRDASIEENESRLCFGFFEILVDTRDYRRGLLIIWKLQVQIQSTVLKVGLRQEFVYIG